LIDFPSRVVWSYRPRPFSRSVAAAPPWTAAPGRSATEWSGWPA